ncbi:hypothetical protein GCM10009867_34940 [Pedococcus aerophilus]|uniref:Putative Flp pilus-assembly TadG-like N-terminal domain-containing protein n=1 Tax=Pedococcus aerophilus TaxID=436356 RepID=A0ABN3UWR8_9MICO
MVLTRGGIFLRARGDERGAVAVVVAGLMTVLILCAAIVMDIGNAKDVRRQSQNASDAAALAAANVLIPAEPATTCSSGPSAPPCFTAAVDAIKNYSRENFGVTSADWASCSITSAQRLTYTPAGESTCISFDNATSPKTVRVWLPTRTVRTFFGGITGRSTIPVGSQADAIIESRTKCTLCFLGSVDAQNADFDVTGGAIAVNGNVSAGPNSIWTSQANGVVGTVSGGQFNPAPTQIQPFSDPLATTLTLPINIASLPLKTDPCTEGPGRYASISLGNNDTCVLAAGFYAVTGTWQIGNNSLIDGTAGVTIYAPASNGYLNFKNGNVKINPSTTGTYAGYSIIYDRTNTQPISLQGNGVTGISGIVYAPSSPLDFNGNSCFGFSGGPVVVSGVQLANGNQSCVKILNPVDQTVARTPLHLTK